MFLLKAYRPERFRETIRIDLRREAERLAAELGIDAEAAIAEAVRPWPRLGAESAPAAGRRGLPGAGAGRPRGADHAVFTSAAGEPVRFGEVGWPWQTRLLRIWADTRLVVVLKARQLGVSWLAAIFALWTALRRPAQEVLLVSRNQADADKLLAKVADLYERLPTWRPAAVVNLRSIRFGHGSEIEALPATENVGRSRTAALVVLDEHTSTWLSRPA